MVAGRSQSLFALKIADLGFVQIGFTFFMSLRPSAET
jgi:hypothetical protein